MSELELKIDIPDKSEFDIEVESLDILIANADKVIEYATTAWHMDPDIPIYIHTALSDSHLDIFHKDKNYANLYANYLHTDAFPEIFTRSKSTNIYYITDFRKFATKYCTQEAIIRYNNAWIEYCQVLLL